MATEFYTVAPNFRRYSVRNFLHIALLAHRILRLLLDFWKKFCCADLRFDPSSSTFTSLSSSSSHIAPSEYEFAVGSRFIRFRRMWNCSCQGTARRLVSGWRPARRRPDVFVEEAPERYLGFKLCFLCLFYSISKLYYTSAVFILKFCLGLIDWLSKFASTG